MTKHVHRGFFLFLAIPLFVILFVTLIGNTWAAMGPTFSHCCDSILSTTSISAWSYSSTGEHEHQSSTPLDHDGCSNSQDCAQSTCGMCSSAGLPCVGWLNDDGRKSHREGRHSLAYHLAFLSPPNPPPQD